MISNTNPLLTGQNFQIVNLNEDYNNLNWDGMNQDFNDLNLQYLSCVPGEPGCNRVDHHQTIKYETNETNSMK